MTDTYLSQLVEELRQAAVDKAMEFWEHGQGPDVTPTRGTAGGTGPTVPYEQLRATARQRIEARFGEISEMFAPYLDMPSTGRLAAIGDEVDDALVKLSPGAEIAGDTFRTPAGGRSYPANPKLSIRELERAMDPWTGDAADAFRTAVLDVFKDVEYNQFLIGIALRGAIGAEQALWTSARHDIAQIAINTKHAIEQMQPVDHSQTDWTLTFTVLASVFAVIAVPLGVGVAGISFAIAAGASQAIAAVPISGEVQYSAGNPDDAVTQLYGAIKRLGDDIHETEERLAQYLRDTIAAVQKCPQLFQFERPKLDDATPSNATSTEYFGEAQ